MMKNRIYIIMAVVCLVLAAGIYRFNFTDDDVYITLDDGHVISYNDNQAGLVVMRRLFSVDASTPWFIDVPHTNIVSPLTGFIGEGRETKAMGEYQDEADSGQVILDYTQILALNLGDTDSEMIFVVPFIVTHQGSGTFWYLGLFRFDLLLNRIQQLDSRLLGDRILLNNIRVDTPFDVSSSVLVDFLTHSEQQAFSEPPTQSEIIRFKVTERGFID